MRRPTPEAVRAMVERTGWPPVTLGRLRIAGKDQWRAVLAAVPPLVPSECASITRQLWRQLLCLTPVGRRRLRRWLDAQRGRPLPVEPVPASRQRIATTLGYFGDREPFTVIIDALTRMPRPVSDHVVDHCNILITGRSSAGMTTGPLPPGRRDTIQIAGHLDEAEIARVAAHEFAHAWLIDFPQAPTTVAFHDSLHHLATRIDAIGNEYGDKDAGHRLVRAFIDNGEDEADWLAWSWGEGE